MKIRLPKTRRYRVALYIVSVLLILLAIDLTWVTAWRRVTIGYETTRITAPLKSNGTPDYVRYIDEQLAKGVTNDNNAFVPYAQAFMPLSERAREETYHRLGIDAPTETSIGDTFSTYMQKKNSKQESEAWAKYGDEEDLVRKQPWSPADHPDVVQWLAASDKALNTFQQMSMRPNWYVPITHSELMISVLLPSLGPIRMMGDMAVTRAMMNIHEGRFAQARADLMACHRVSRALAHSFTVIEYLVALAVDSNALSAEGPLVAALPPEQLKEHMAELDGLPPWPSLAHSMDSERFSMLDALLYVSAHPAGRARFEADVSSSSNGAEPTVTATLLSLLVPAHYDAVLRECNGFYDRYVAAANTPNIVERQKLAATIAKDVESYALANVNGIHDPARHFAANLLPSFGRIYIITDTRVVKEQLVRVAVALEQYRADVGSYPDSLAPLAPKYLASIPVDGFTGQPLRYQRKDGSYLLYSVGSNGIDDGGNSRDAKYPKADDIAIHP